MQQIYAYYVMILWNCNTVFCFLSDLMINKKLNSYAGMSYSVLNTSECGLWVLLEVCMLPNGKQARVFSDVALGGQFIYFKIRI